VTAAERLTPTRRLVIGAFTLIMAGAGFAAGRTAFRPAGNVTQPIQFNHQKHVKDVGMECLACHEYYATREHSGLPALATCLGCHEGGVTDSPEEKRLLELAERDPQPSFRKLFRLPDHAYYSHRRHVAVAGLKCETCHGAIADTTAPPSRPLVRITMDTCVGCHAEQSVKTDCTDCHR
jgi:hypothetical protein